MSVVSKLRQALPFKKSSVQHNQEHDKNCGNCGTTITSNFCPECGQSAHVHHSLLHLLEEMAHGLWHFDAKGWRTFPLLFAYPGELTRRYIDGQRMRFISPLALFLFSVFFMFFLMSFSSNNFSPSDNTKKSAEQVALEVRQGVDAELTATKARISQLQNDIAAAQKTGKNSDSLQEDLLEEQNAQKELEVFSETEMKDAKSDALSPNIAAKNIKKKSKLFSATWVKESVKHARENPDLFAYKMKSYAYKFALILVPVSLPFLWLVFFWRKGITMFDHAVFSLYSLSFMAMFFGLISLLFAAELEGTALFLIFSVPPIHMFRQLKGTYKLGIAATLWRTFYLQLVAFIMVILFLFFIMELSAH